MLMHVTTGQVHVSDRLNDNARIRAGGGGGGRGPDPTWKMTKNIGFLSKTVPDPLNITKLPSQH